MMRLAAAVSERGEEFAQLEARDTGKSHKTARADATALARYFEYYGGACDKLHGETLPYEPGYTVFTIREPHGVTGHIIPWNYPMQIFGRTVGASLAAGNACVVKPAEDASLSILRLAEVAAEIGFPAGTLNVVTGYGHEAGAALTAHPGIDHISFTGSTVTGQRVAEAAARRQCPVTLELGGKSPQLVFDDADLDAAMPVVLNAIIQNAGQTCSAGSRLLVQRGVYETVLERLAERFGALRAGPPALELEMGPLVNKKQYDQVQRFVRQAEEARIPVMARGTLHPDAASSGYYQAAVLFRDVPHDSELAQREIFGPVLAAMPFDRRGGRDPPGQWHRLRARRRHLDPRRRPPAAGRAQAAVRPGVHQQLRRRRRRGAAVRRRQVERPRSREGLRGAHGLHRAQDDRHQARLTPIGHPPADLAAPFSGCPLAPCRRARRRNPRDSRPDVPSPGPPATRSGN